MAGLTVGEVLLASSGQKVRDAAKHLTGHRTAQNKEYVAQNISGVE